MGIRCALSGEKIAVDYDEKMALRRLEEEEEDLRGGGEGGKRKVDKGLIE